MDFNYKQFIIYFLLFNYILFSQENNYSLNFDGENDFIEIPNSNIFPFDNNDFSISFQIKFAENDSDGTILDKMYYDFNNTHGIYIRQYGDEIQVALGGYGDFTYIYIGDYLNNEWLNFTLSCTWGEAAVIYINANVIETIPIADINVQSIENQIPLCIGNELFPNSFPFNGSLDNIQLWNFALSTEDIQNYIDCIPSGTEDGLVAYWNFEEGSSEGQVIDVSGNGNNGILFGGNYLEDVPEQICQDNNEENNLTTLIGDLNCDGDINGLDSQILDSLIFQLQDPNTLVELYPCLNSNLSGLSNESINALQNTIQALSYQTNSQNTKLLDFWFPDGYNSDIIYNTDESYIVPNGKTLYITNIEGGWFLNIPNGPNGYNLSDRVGEQPIILPEGTEIVVPYTQNLDSFEEYFIGFLVNKGVDIIITGSTYLVPEDSVFCLVGSNTTNTIYGPEINYSDSLNAANILNDMQTIPKGTMFKSGTEINGNLLNGYLIHQDYFLSESSINNTTSATSATAIMDYTTGYSSYDDCDYINSLPVGTIIYNPQLDSSGMIVDGIECGSSMERIFDASSGDPLCCTGQTLFFMAVFTVNDTIVINNLHTWKMGDNDAKQYLYSFGDYIDNFDPNTLSNPNNVYGINCEICAGYTSGSNEVYDDPFTIENPDINLIMDKNNNGIYQIVLTPGNIYGYNVGGLLSFEVSTEGLNFVNPELFNLLDLWAYTQTLNNSAGFTLEGSWSTTTSFTYFSQDGVTMYPFGKALKQF